MLIIVLEQCIERLFKCLGVPDRNIFISLKVTVTVLGVSPVQPSD